MKPMSVEFSQEGGFAGLGQRWALHTDTLPAPAAQRLSSLMAAAWAALTSPALAGGPSAVEPDDVSAQAAPARDRQLGTLTCLRGDEELTCRVLDGERLPEPVAALVRFVKTAGRRSPARLRPMA